MKIVLFVFSGTGNTRFAAKRIAEAFEGDMVTLVSIERHFHDAQRLIDDCDRFGLGYPTYGSDVPRIVKEFLGGCNGNAKPAFVFCTQLMFSGDGADVGGRLLRARGFRVLWQEHFFFPNNISDVALLRPFRAAKPEAIQRRTARKANRFVQRIRSGNPWKKGSNPLSRLLGLTQRLPFRLMEESWTKSRLRVETETCVGCGVCAENCPTHNFELVDQKAVPSDKCTLCYRCVNHCPVQAIRLAGNAAVRPYRGPLRNTTAKDLSGDSF